MSRPVALVSCAEARHRDIDLDPIVRALGDRGCVVEVVDWDDPDQDWSRFAAAIIRSPWDYHKRYDEFLPWAQRVSTKTKLFNNADVIAWNTDKLYLRDMVADGIPVIPTHFVENTADVDGLVDICDGDIVVKPTVSAGSNNTERHVHNAHVALSHIKDVLAMGKKVMVQPYQKFIDERGETGLVYFNGEFSHAFRKGPILKDGSKETNGLFVVEDIRPRRASQQERELGDQVIDYIHRTFGAHMLYARVDVVRGSGGYPVLMELEMTEPSFFFHTSADSATRFASAVLARL